MCLLSCSFVLQTGKLARRWGKDGSQNDQGRPKLIPTWGGKAATWTPGRGGGGGGYEQTEVF